MSNDQAQDVEIDHLKGRVRKIEGQVDDINTTLLKHVTECTAQKEADRKDRQDRDKNRERNENRRFKLMALLISGVGLALAILQYING